MGDTHQINSYVNDEEKNAYFHRIPKNVKTTTGCMQHGAALRFHPLVFLSVASSPVLSRPANQFEEPPYFHETSPPT